MEGLFGDEERVSLHDIEGTFPHHFEAVAGMLYDESMEREWFTADPDRLRRRFSMISIFGLIAAAVAFIAAYETTTWALPFLPPLLAALGVLLFWPKMPARTAEGSRLLSEIRGLRRYLETAETETMRFAQDAGELVQLLPFAIALGLTDRWSRILGAVVDAPLAESLAPLLRTSHDLADAVDHFAVTMSATIAATPGGFLGGGGGSSNSAGGGFGGGGGRAW